MIQVFTNPVFGAVRTEIDEKGRTLFCASDVANALGYSNSRKAVSDHCAHVTKRYMVSYTTNQYGTTTKQTVEASFIPESDLYRLIVSSKLPQAQQFENWVFEEVLPTIRKTGGVYATKEGIEQLIADPAATIKLLEAIQAERQEKEALRQEVVQKEAALRHQAPKVAYANRVLQSESLIPTTVIAKELGYSAKRLNELLHERKVIYNQSGTWVLYSKYQGMGFTKTKTTTFTDSTGNERTQIHTYWTESGRKFIHELLNRSLQPS